MGHPGSLRMSADGERFAVSCGGGVVTNLALYRNQQGNVAAMADCTLETGDDLEASYVEISPDLRTVAMVLRTNFESTIQASGNGGVVRLGLDNRGTLCVASDMITTAIPSAP